MTEILQREYQTEIIIHNDESILYSTKWLDRPVMTTNDGYIFSSNREIITGKEKIPTDFIDPYLFPELLTKERQQSNMTPKQWRDSCEDTYPGIDTQAQYKLRKEECKQERMANCGEWHYHENYYHPGDKVCLQWRCKQKECGHCKLAGIEKHQERIGKTLGMTAYLVTPEQEKEIKATRGKNDYLRVADDNGDTYLILNCKLEDGFTQKLTVDNDLIDRLGEIAFRATKRISGNLGGKPSMPANKDQGNEDDLLNIEERETVFYREYKLEFTEESTIQDCQELDAMVLKQIEFDDKADKTIDLLQYTLYQLEETRRKVYEKACVKIHFLYKKQSNILLSKVDWGLLEGKQKE